MATLQAGPLRLVLTADGRLASLLYLPTGTECQAEAHPSSLLGLTVGGRELASTALEGDADGSALRLSFGPGGPVAHIRVLSKPTHLVLELTAIDGPIPERITWGPLHTSIGAIVGETVCVVRDARMALGLQSLNIQTSAGAAATDFGSRLHATAIQREGGVVGSRVALFACAADQALATIGEIEVAEGLPHPMLDGEWAKVSQTARLSYLIAPFGEDNLDELISFTRRAGFRYLYHPGPFETWGHFRLHPASFPDGDEGLRRCVERAEAAGVRLGVHTLTGFITTNDPYVTPVPDPRLARSATTSLAAAIDATATEIPIADATDFRRPVPWEKPLNTVIIGQELAQYDAISEGPPWRLLDCKRGAWGTTAMAHPAGADIGRLADHAYGTFYPGIENGLMDEMTDRLVQLVNTTGIRQLSYDGLEGLSAYGYGGDYSRNRFVKQCYDGFQTEVINDASNLLHYLWHIHTRMNWGEPWGKPMREGMAEYRFKNQEYFERNLFPRMLGWWDLRLASGDLEASTLEDFEWMFARAAGFDAGFAITTDLSALRGNGQAGAILDAARQWETARLAGAFSPDQRQRLRDPKTEWHLEADGEGRWRLSPVDLMPLPGPAAGITNRFAAQPLRFVVRVTPGPAADGIANLRCRLGEREVRFAAELRPGQYLVCDGQGAVAICDANWNVMGHVALANELPVVPTGESKIEWAWEGDGKAHVTLKLIGPTETVAR
ncbi:MAG: hypothetical protein HPY69_06905 [Armatimonadetes bacterium]|nr:hypothetical protein [Armatimonadota bacterium]